MIEDHSRPCGWRQPFGWYCRRDYHPSGPCACTPKWWNLLARWRYRGLSS